MKASLVGLATAMIAVIVWFLVEFWLPMTAAMWMAWSRGESSGMGAVSSGPESLTLPVLIGFAGGFYWFIRRTRRRIAAAR